MPRLSVRGYLAALPSIIRQQEDEFSFRVYVTDSLRLSGESKYLSARWLDMVRRKPEDTRTGDEIAADVIKRAGLKQKGGEPV